MTKCAGQTVREDATRRHITRCGADANYVITFAVKGPHLTAFTLPLCFVHGRLWRSAAESHGMEMLVCRAVTQLRDELPNAAPEQRRGQRAPAEPPTAGVSRGTRKDRDRAISI